MSIRFSLDRQVRDWRHCLCQSRKREPAQFLKAWCLLVDPNADASMANRKGPQAFRVDDHLAIFEAEDILPSLPSMSLPDEHLFRPSIPAVGHDDREAGAVGVQPVAQSRPPDTVDCVEIVPLRPVRIELSGGDEPDKLASTGRKSRARAVVAKDIAPEHAWRAGVVAEENERVRKRNEPFLDGGSQRLHLLRVMVGNERLWHRKLVADAER